MASDMENRIPLGDDQSQAEPPRLRQLRWLVNALTITLILGFLVIVATLVVRMSAMPRLPALPDDVILPAGETTQAVTIGTDWLAVVTIDEAGNEFIRVFGAANGIERASVQIDKNR